MEFGSVGDFVSAITTPGRQSALTVEEYNAASPSFRQEYAPGLGGARALSASQSAQLSAFGGYSNTVGGGYTIPTIGGVTSFSGTIKSAPSISDSDSGGGFVGGSGISTGISSAQRSAFSDMGSFQVVVVSVVAALVR